MEPRLGTQSTDGGSTIGPKLLLEPSSSSWCDIIRECSSAPYYTPYFDPVNGAYIAALSPLEMELIQSPIGERLSGIKQMPTFAFTTAGSQAQHTRLMHSIGAMELCGTIARSIQVIDSDGNVIKLPDAKDGIGLPKRDEQLLRIAGLLHDASHMALSHSLEDTEERLGINYNHDKALAKFLTEFGAEEILERHGFSLDELMQIFQHGHPYAAIIKSFADRGDYLRRDLQGARVEELEFDYVKNLTKSLAMNLVLKIDESLNAEDRITQALLCIRNYVPDSGFNAWAAIQSVCATRRRIFEDMGLHPSSEVARELIISDLELGLENGEISKEQLLSIATKGNDADLLALLSTETQHRLQLGSIEQLVPIVATIDARQLPELSKLSDFEWDSLLKALRSEFGNNHSYPEQLVCRTRVRTKDLFYRIVDMTGKVEALRVACDFPPERTMVFLASLAPLDRTESDSLQDRFNNAVISWLIVRSAGLDLPPRQAA